MPVSGHRHVTWIQACFVLYVSACIWRLTPAKLSRWYLLVYTFRYRKMLTCRFTQADGKLALAYILQTASVECWGNGAKKASWLVQYIDRTRRPEHFEQCHDSALWLWSHALYGTTPCPIWTSESEQTVANLLKKALQALGSTGKTGSGWPTHTGLPYLATIHAVQFHQILSVLVHYDIKINVLCVQTRERVLVHQYNQILKD